MAVISSSSNDFRSEAFAGEFMRGAQDAGHKAELADLNAEGFDPRWSMADIEGDETGLAPTDVLAEQERVARADAVAFVFPLFWWGMPAMTKGWIDRVWSWGWAYDQLDDPNLSLQPARSAVLLVAAGARSDEMQERGYTAALERLWTEGTFGYFGFSPRETVLLNGTKGSDARRRDLLQRSFDAGKSLRPPGPQETAALTDA